MRLFAIVCLIVSVMTPAAVIAAAGFNSNANHTANHTFSRGINPHTFDAHDTLAIAPDPSATAQQFLDAMAWKPSPFKVVCTTVPGAAYDALVRFPSPRPSGNKIDDTVWMQWYAARNKAGKVITAPAVLVLHESGAAQTVGRIFARALARKGFQAFMMDLPYYHRRSDGHTLTGGPGFAKRVRQAIADARRARDAIAVLPHVDKRCIVIQGTSLGGFIAAMAGSLDHAFDGVFIVVAGGDLDDVVMHGKKDAAGVRQRLALAGYTGAKLKRELWKVEPTRVAHRLNPQRTWLFSAEQDQVVPLRDARALAQAANLGPGHFIKMSGGHYTAAIHLPQIIYQISRHIRAIARAEDIPPTASAQTRARTQP